MTFTWHDVELEYETGDYNDAARNERTVEVPIARHFIGEQATRDGIEVGNVMSHYGPMGWSVYDRYEQAPGVVNRDVFDIETHVNWIVSVSTLEHVRWDCHGGGVIEEGGSQKAIEHLRALLRPGGRMLVTVPFGVNPPLDEAILFHELGVARECTFLRDGDHGWRQAHRPDAWKPYGPHWANAVWIGEWTAA